MSSIVREGSWFDGVDRIAPAGCWAAATVVVAVDVGAPVAAGTVALGRTRDAEDSWLEPDVQPARETAETRSQLWMAHQTASNVNPFIAFGVFST